MNKQKGQTTARKGNVKLVSKISITHILGRLLKIVLVFLILHLIGLILFLIPLIGLLFSALIGLVCWIYTLDRLIGLVVYCFSRTVITSDGIYGRDKRCKGFDYRFDQIQKFERSGTKILICADVVTKKGQIKRKEHVIPMINSVEFEEAYNQR